MASSRRLSCGVVILNPERELLLCHVTGQRHWDLPKGNIDPGEAPLDAALRETREETGLRLDAEMLTDLGRHAYTHRKDLHLYAVRVPRFELDGLHCCTTFAERGSGRLLPEMDGYGWFDLGRIDTLCTPNMARLLIREIDLEGWLRRLPLTAAAPSVEPRG